MKNSINLLLITYFLLYTSSCNQDLKKVEFSKYSYKYSIEDLHEKFSNDVIESAKNDREELNRINQNGKYQANFESLDKHKTPDWYKDAKLGIFYDFGLYSVAGYGNKGWSRARYPDWYLSQMYRDARDYHIKTWGEDFERDDFIPLFTIENFNAKEVIELVKYSGAKFFVPFSKHHDGYCLWKSKYTHRDVVDMFPGKDLTKELVEACKKAKIFHGFYFSVEEYEYPLINENNELYIRYWSKGLAPDNAGTVEEEGKVSGDFISEKHNRMISGKIPVYDFTSEFLVPQAKEFIDKYDPDIIWFDGEWMKPAEYYKTKDIVAYFYNKAEGRKKVVSNDRFGIGTRGKHGDFYTSETDEVVDKLDYPWEECRSMSESYGYNRFDSPGNYLSADELIKMLVRIVAKGGNLNLIVNPDGTGKIPQIQIDLLKELGNWLKINGEAIYGTRTYEKVCDNTQLGQPVWYTMSKDSTYGYAIIFDWPKSKTFICSGVNIVWESRVYMLGYDKPLEWVDTGKKHWGLSAKIPDEMVNNPSVRPCKYAWVLKFEYDKENRFGN